MMGVPGENGDDATLVISAPQSLSGLLAIQSGARLTTGVLVELAVEAANRLVLASPYLHVESLLREGVVANAINRALERGVRVEIASAASHIKRAARSLVEYSRGRGFSSQSISAPRQYDR